MTHRTLPLFLLVLPSCSGGFLSPPEGPTDAPTILSATVVHVSTSQAEIATELSAPTPMVAACVRRYQPDEVHLVDGTGQTSVTFRFAGLLASTDYDCSLASLLPGGSPVAVSFRTPTPEGELASADAIFQEDRPMTGSYTLMNVKPECFGERATNYLTILDADGENRWRYDLPAGMNIGVEVTADGPNRFLWGGGQSNAGAPAVVDLFDGPVWSLAFPGSEDVIFHHDARRIADHRVLSVEESDDPGWAAFRLRLSDDGGTTSWTWDANDDGVASGFLEQESADGDPHHLNWADVVDTPEGLVAYGSLCYAYQVIAIDVATGTGKWKFGPGGDFALIDENGAPLPDDEYPQCQHGLQVDGTHLLVYDNGFDRGFTRVVEYTLDTDAMVAMRTWEWADESAFWELYHGGADWLTPEHDRVLVAEANNSCGGASDRPSQIVEVDRTDDTVVHRLVMRDVGHWIYRAHRLDGCAVFANSRYCPAVADRLNALRPVLGLTEDSR